MLRSLFQSRLSTHGEGNIKAARSRLSHVTTAQDKKWTTPTRRVNDLKGGRNPPDGKAPKIGRSSVIRQFLKAAFLPWERRRHDIIYLRSGSIICV